MKSILQLLEDRSNKIKQDQEAKLKASLHG